MIKIISDEKEIIEFEYLRYRVLGIKEEVNNVVSTYYSNELSKGNMIALGFYKEKLISGCIISKYLNNLHIEWIFTDKEYCNKGYASELIKYIVRYKSIFEEYFNKKFSVLTLESIDIDAKLYVKNGFHGNKNNIMRKRI